MMSVTVATGQSNPMQTLSEENNESHRPDKSPLSASHAEARFDNGSSEKMTF